MVTRARNRSSSDARVLERPRRLRRARQRRYRGRMRAIRNSAIGRLSTLRERRSRAALCLGAAAACMMPGVARSAEGLAEPWRTGGNRVGHFLWALANVSYAGMRAQNHPSAGWRAVAFIFGLPGTIISYFAVREGSHRAYGIALPPPPPGAGR